MRKKVTGWGLRIVAQSTRKHLSRSERILLTNGGADQEGGERKWSIVGDTSIIPQLRLVLPQRPRRLSFLTRKIPLGERLMKLWITGGVLGIAAVLTCLHYASEKKIEALPSVAIEPRSSFLPMQPVDISMPTVVDLVDLSLLLDPPVGGLDSASGVDFVAFQESPTTGSQPSTAANSPQPPIPAAAEFEE